MIAAGPRPRRQDLPRQGPRGPLPDGARRQAAARVDRRGRLAGGAAGAGRRAPQEPREARVGRRGGRDRRGGAWRPSATCAARRSRPRLVRFEIAAPEGDCRVGRPAHLARRAATSRSTRPTPRARRGSGCDRLNALAAAAPGGHRGDDAPLLVARQPIPRLLRRGQAQEDRRHGRPAQKICDAPTGADGTWSPEGVILFDGTGTDPIQRVSAAGGTPVGGRQAGRRRARKAQVGWPEFLPDGRHFLYMAIGQKADDSVYRIGTLDSNEIEAARAGADAARPTRRPGYLLFVRDRTLVAQRFDAKALKTTGEPRPAGRADRRRTTSASRAFSVSRDGVLAYRTGESGNRLVWVDRNGKELETCRRAGRLRGAGLSPRRRPPRVRPERRARGQRQTSGSATSPGA